MQQQKLGRVLQFLKKSPKRRQSDQFSTKSQMMVSGLSWIRNPDPDPDQGGQKRELKASSVTWTSYSVADPDPGSGAFLTPGRPYF
jgi:hypothetical protein